ncbi:hypothetical protein TNCV_1754291 [Trichonephila clavipes]|nr:hypothetical protein TNCV_1754291 [Trichonephila clavipes]
MGWDAQLAVSSKNQKQFFKTVGGFRNVCIVNPPVGNHVYGCIHFHNRLVSFPCAAKAARTLAMNLNRMPQEDLKKVIQVMDNEGKPMDKIDEHKLLEQCDKDPEEETPNEPMDGTLESIDKSIDLEQEVMEQISMDTFSEIKISDYVKNVNFGEKFDFYFLAKY